MKIIKESNHSWSIEIDSSREKFVWFSSLTKQQLRHENVLWRRTEQNEKKPTGNCNLREAAKHNREKKTTCRMKMWKKWSRKSLKSPTNDAEAIEKYPSWTINWKNVVIRLHSAARQPSFFRCFDYSNFLVRQQLKCFFHAVNKFVVSASVVVAACLKL